MSKKTILKLSIALILLFNQNLILSQQLEIEPYEFITASNDTVQAERGTFMVKENREKSSSDSIQLSFIRFKSTNPNPSNPIVYLSGGPGGSGSETAKYERFELFMKLREVADVIAFDQRGTGMSDKLIDCPIKLNIPISEPLTKDDYLKITTDNLKKCKSFWESEKVDLSAYNTTESAKDLDALRKVLDVNKISLWGISYGSHLGFEYIRLFEENIKKMVLASLESPDETLRLPSKTDAFLNEICERAKDNYGMSPKYPDLKNKIIEVHRRLKEKPVIVDIEDDKGKKIKVGISDFELQIAITAIYLRDPSISNKIPKLYLELYNGNFSEIAPMVKLIKQSISEPENPMSFAMDMHSGASDARKKEIRKELKNSLLGDGINYLMLDWIDELNYFHLPEEFRKLKENNVNALLLSGKMDGRTYLSSAVEIAKSFKNGQHIIIDNAGHNLYMLSPVIGYLVLEFFKGKELNVSEIKLKPVTFE
ncbi:alpha/beta fold hydrolase [Tamlana sp. 2_MG-2023]|uniref:alpha/beta fold hydrolase n=1 Tax=unclassified Tamlana TaxID=2614803 RepID=UPI0026E1B542|nr:MULTISPECIES: alpha/beta fold hydrolase [unclassified Tamlana]MDO6761892.1 alpha/beta fold hydrolase [Tamlana sp. 2_MG-2023]MDO6792217.1 alpha/beta fold hydrolase [Tamlana sp. 1_MG-2023]